MASLPLEALKKCLKRLPEIVCVVNANEDHALALLLLLKKKTVMFTLKNPWPLPWKNVTPLLKRRKIKRAPTGWI